MWRDDVFVVRNNLVAKQTDVGVPVLYMPYFDFRRRIIKHRVQESKSDFILPLEIILSKIYIQYDDKKSIVFDKNDKESTIEMNVFFFDKICSYLDLTEIVKTLRSYISINSFTFYYLLEYACYKNDIRLINVLLLKLSKSTMFGTNMVMDIVTNICSKRLSVKLPKDYVERLFLYFINDGRFGKNSPFNDIYYLKTCVISLTQQTCISIILHDRVDIVKVFHKKMGKKINLLQYALRYNSQSVLKYLYSTEKPIKDYINLDFLNEENIDPNDTSVLDFILESRDLSFIKKMYDNAINLQYLNNRICISIPVRKNDYQTTEFLLSKGAKPDDVCLIYVGHNGSIDMMYLLFKYGCKKFRQKNDFSEYTSKHMIYYAAYAGKIDMLKELYRNGYKFGPEILNYIIQGGHLIINDIKSIDNVFEPLQEHLLTYASMSDKVDLETIEYLYYKGSKLQDGIINNIARSGSLDVFRFYMSKGIKIDQHTMNNLASRGQNSIIRSLYNNVVPVISFSGQVGNITITRFFTPLDI
jgi:hypothetical protein